MVCFTRRAAPVSKTLPCHELAAITFVKIRVSHLPTGLIFEMQCAFVPGFAGSDENINTFFLQYQNI